MSIHPLRGIYIAYCKYCVVRFTLGCTTIWSTIYTIMHENSVEIYNWRNCFCIDLSTHTSYACGFDGNSIILGDVVNFNEPISFSWLLLTRGFFFGGGEGEWWFSNPLKSTLGTTYNIQIYACKTSKNRIPFCWKSLKCTLFPPNRNNVTNNIDLRYYILQLGIECGPTIVTLMFLVLVSLFIP